ncbi:MAG: LytTR family transcriptional regulator DNA-binding domain-containing protein [Defluviitaleaceae bacterium]|nr:LytTR family transcriptional regulator DNA-binding domain-containing protein [Defluviitaleaceae bacterium]MCL2836771.1 LytTR family transcriptional regulator DNA-binding domain-containing protein [Defluviitaleaceae bacterium]
MRIIIQDPAPGENDSVTISVRCMTDNITRAINLLKSPDSLTVYIDEQVFMLPVGDIFYVESVDLKTYVCAAKTVYRSRLKLYEIEDALSTGDFLRVSKQVIVNVKKIKSVSPAGDSRFRAMLANGEKVMISRQYVPALKERFGL